MGLLLIALLGVFNGLRTMTPIAVVCWFAFRHTLHLTGWRSFTANIISVAIFTLLALGEYIGDKLPNTPSRTSPVGLAGRVLFGAIVGFILAEPLMVSPVLGAVCGVAGALVGTYGGWFVRTRSVEALGVPDWPVAIVEDCIAIAGSILILNAAVRIERTIF